MTSSKELEIISRVLAGEKNAFEELVTANQNKVYSLALKLLGNEQDALDISQDAFVRAYLGLGKFRGDSRFSVWMYRMTYNLCVDFLRKNKRERTVPLTVTDETGNETELEIPDFTNVPQDLLERRELRDTISKAVGTLSGKYRDVFILRELSGMSYSEIAVTLGISEGTVKSRLNRARGNLLHMLKNTEQIAWFSRQSDVKEVDAHDK